MSSKAHQIAVVLLLGGACLGVHHLVRAQFKVPDMGTSSPLMWRAFDPLVVAFGDGDARAAVSYLRAASSVLRKLDAHLERDATTEEFRKTSMDSLEDFDLKGFHDLLPNRDPDGFRSFAFEGFAAPSAYKVRAGMKKPPASARGFGESYGAVRMKRASTDEEDRYLFQLRGGVGLGKLRWPALLAGVVNAGGLLEPAEELPMALRAAENFLRTRQPELGPVDRRVLATFWGSYPAAAKVVLPISHTSDVVVEDDTPDVAKFHLVTSWDLAGMARGYPELADYFKDLEDMADARFRVTDGNGNALAGLHADTRSVTARTSAVLRDGKVVATRASSKELTEPSFEHMRVTSDFHFVLHRLHFIIENFQIDVRYKELPDGFELHARAVGKPKVRVTGAAFGVFPARMLDWFIPGDTEGLARRMLELSMSGNQGRGMRLDLRLKEAPTGATVDWSFETELLDSPLVRFCMAVISDGAIPSDKQEADIRRLAVDYRNAFDEDLERFAKFGSSMQPPSESTK